MSTIDCKVCIIGDVDVGKTSLVRRFVEDDFSHDKVKTKPVDNLTKEFPLNGKTYNFNIWDTAGDERFRNVIGIYYRGAKAVIVVYDSTSSESFSSLDYWLSEVKKKSESDCVVMIAANKTDLTDEREVTKEEGENLARNHKKRHFETSALTGHNVPEIFKTIALSIGSKSTRADSGIVDLHGERNANTKRGCCS